MLGEGLLLAAKKHRKPPPLPPHVLERRAAAAAADALHTPPRGRALPIASGASAAAAAARPPLDARASPLEPPPVIGTSPGGLPITAPVHRRPPPLPTGGAANAALHSRQHTRAAAGGGRGAGGGAAPGGAAQGAGRVAGGGRGAVQGLRLRKPGEAHAGGWDDSDLDLEVILPGGPQPGGHSPPLAAMAWRGQHGNSRGNSPLGSPTSSSIHSSEGAVPP